MVLHKKNNVNLDDDDSTLDTCQTLFYTHMPTINGEDEEDNIHANRIM